MNEAKSKVRWGGLLPSMGALVAGGALLAGIALIAPNLFPTIGEWITNLFKSAPLEKLAPEAAKAAAEASAKTWILIQKVAGAALAGSGLAYFMGKKEDNLAPAQADVAESFAIREQMKAANAMMVMRAAYAGNPEAQAMLAQQMGRG